MAIQTITIDTEQWAVVPMDLMRRIEDYLSTERVSAGESLYNDVLGAMMAAATQTEQAQQSDKDRLRFRSACEISGDKHPEYVRGYEAAMDAVCKAQPAPIPRNERMPTQDDADCKAQQAGEPVAQQSGLKFPAPYALIEIDVDTGVRVVDQPSHKTVEVFSRKQVLDLLSAAAPQPEQPKPIPRNERMPALADADPFGMVAWWNSFDNFWVLTNWDSKPARPIFTHWLPTGLKMPPAPGGKQ